MKFFVFILCLSALPVAGTARNHELATDLASAGYALSTVREIDHQPQRAVRPSPTIESSFATSRQITADLASAGYGPAGVSGFVATDDPVDRSPRPEADYRTADVIRADLASAGYVPANDTGRIAGSVKG